MSPMLAWRAELRASAERARLAASLRRIERSADGAHLAGATPLNRIAVRTNVKEIDAVMGRDSARHQPVQPEGSSS